MINRKHMAIIRRRLRQFPAVALLGPRQCGKTTLAKMLDGVYFDLEREGAETRLDAEWQSLVASRRLVILDEAQSVPKVFSRLRGAIDDDRKRNGRFLLLGSVAPALMKNISQSLAGRLSSVRLSPFILPELPAKRMDDLWFYGGYPDGGIGDSSLFPVWQRDYMDALVQRDLPTWGFPARPRTTNRLVRMLAAVHGQVLNAAQLAGSLAVDGKTIVGYCDYLEGAFLIRRLAPYHANIRKRLVKRPKVYWRDSGLLHSLLNVEDREHLFSQPWVGASWEGFVIEQTLATLEAIGKRSDAYFLRTSDGYELDLVLRMGKELWAVEIKLTSNPSTGDVDRLHKTADMIKADRRFLVCRLPRKIENNRLLVTHLSGWLRRLMA